MEEIDERGGRAKEVNRHTMLREAMTGVRHASWDGIIRVKSQG